MIGLRPGLAIAAPRFGASAPAGVILVSAAESTFTTSAPTVDADDTTTVTLTLTAKNAAGAVLRDLTVSLSASGTGNTLGASSGTTNASGVFATTFKTSVAGDKVITVSVGGVALTVDVEGLAVGGNDAVITSISPRWGLYAGGETITVTGTGFQSGDTWEFGSGHSATRVFVNSTTVTLTAPAGTGRVSIRNTRSGEVVELADCYRYCAFGSDWATDTGITSNALRDGTRWGAADNNSGRLAVVSVASLAGLGTPVTGFPSGMANVLRVELASSGADDLTKTGIGSVMSVGESRSWRLWLAVAVSNGAGNYTSITPNHPFEPATGNDANTWNWNFGSRSTGLFPITLNFLETPWPSRWHPANPQVDLTKFEAYRLEWMVTKTSDSGGTGAATGTACGAYTASARIYDKNGTLVYSDSTLYNQGAVSLAANPAVRCVDTALQKVLVGNNGASTWVGLPAGEYYYAGGLIVCTDAEWPGGY